MEGTGLPLDGAKKEAGRRDLLRRVEPFMLDSLLSGWHDLVDDHLRKDDLVSCWIFMVGPWQGSQEVPTNITTLMPNGLRQDWPAGFDHTDGPHYSEYL